MDLQCYKEEAVCCLYSPLNVSLTSDELHKRDFHYYITQCQDFFDALAQGYDKVLNPLKDQHDDVEATILGRRNNVKQELQRHPQFIQECDLGPTAETSSHHSVAAKCVELLLVAAFGNLDMVHFETPAPAEKVTSAAYVIGFIIPCMMWLFASHAKLIKPATAPGKLPARLNEWTDGCSSDEVKASTLQTEELLNWLSSCLMDEERKILRAIYHEAMKLELAFFYSLLSLPAKLNPVLLVHSHQTDCRCTTVDSSQWSVQNSLSPYPDRKTSKVNRYQFSSVRFPLANPAREQPWNRRNSISSFRNSVASAPHWKSGTATISLSASRNEPIGVIVRTRKFSPRFYTCSHCGFQIVAVANVCIITQLFGRDPDVASVKVIHPPLETVFVQHTDETDDTGVGIAQKDLILCNGCGVQLGACYVMAAQDVETWILHLLDIHLDPLTYTWT